MSWVVEVVTAPMPADTDEAWEELERVREQEDEEHEYGAPPSAALQELYRRLTARYPCIEEDSDSPWSDGPLIDNFRERIATLGILVSQMEEALPFVIDTATEMGFTVFDGGDEAIHRPKGWVPPAEESIPKAPPLPRKWWQFWN